ncbi:MAG: 2-phospho-L-lactate transferase CofD family protein, partial [Candidatus Saccharimonadales bacterium]|nr:2-phospho-L-lactate transferase CofD family protein [Candidatus Saccharimonadales bacterium]
MNIEQERPHLAMIGGGGGASNLAESVSHQREFLRENDILRVYLDIIVTMSDNGGYSGRVLEEMPGVLPPGDAGKVMRALGRNRELADDLGVRAMTWDAESPLSGSTAGHQLLANLTQKHGMIEALERLKKYLDVDEGHSVLPVTTDPTGLIYTYPSGRRRIGEKNISYHTWFRESEPKLSLEPVPRAYEPALQAIEEADELIIAPGQILTSIGAALLVPGVKETINRREGPVIYVPNVTILDRFIKVNTVSEQMIALRALTGVIRFDHVLALDDEKAIAEGYERKPGDINSHLTPLDREKVLELAGSLVAKNYLELVEVPDEGTGIPRFGHRHNADMLAADILTIHDG